MASIWWRSETFAHGMVVYPISLWLIWRKRNELKTLPCRPSWVAMGVIAVAGLGWLLGDLADVEAARQFGFALIIACVVWAVLGTPIAKAIFFPLAFSLLAVPVGEFLLPVLMQHTADFTVGAIRLSGIPVYREGNNFVMPSGSWSVVEACSGLRYLIASVTLGFLYAYLSYRSFFRRAMFVAASIAVPIVANWVRAYMIVMIGHLSGMKYAVGVDHLIYGWLFFGLVMLLLFWIGARWREDPVEQPLADRRHPEAATLSPIFLAGAAVSAAVIAGAPLYAESLEETAPTPDIELAKLAPVGGWTANVDRKSEFRPHYLNARAALEQSFEKGGREVGLYVAYYANERQGSELIMDANDIRPSLDKSWVVTSQSRVPGFTLLTAPVETHLRSGSDDYLVWHWYWAGDRWAARPELVKALQAASRLMGRGDDAALVAIYVKPNGNLEAARQTLKDFRSDMLSPLWAVLRQSHAMRRATAEIPPLASK